MTAPSLTVRFSLSYPWLQVWVALTMLAGTALTASGQAQEISAISTAAPMVESPLPDSTQAADLLPSALEPFDALGFLEPSDQSPVSEGARPEGDFSPAFNSAFNSVTSLEENPEQEAEEKLGELAVANPVLSPALQPTVGLEKIGSETAPSPPAQLTPAFLTPVTHVAPVPPTQSVPVPVAAPVAQVSPEFTEPIPEDPNAGLRIPPNFAEGFLIERVFVYFRNPSSDPEQDATIRRQLTNTFGVRAGGSYSPLFADQGLNQVQQLPFVQEAEYRLYKSTGAGGIIIALVVTLQSEEVSVAPPPQPPTGMLVEGNLRDFPTLYDGDQSLVKLILNGGLGVFSDTNPWFGNADVFLAPPYQPTGTVTWGEFYLEPGLAGITRLGDSPAYLYGAVSYTLSGTVQPDVFRTDDRTYGDLEKLYGGFFVAEADSPFAFNFSAGRQLFQLNQGFLFSQFSGSGNALERAVSYSNPRTAYDITLLGSLRWNDFRLQGFFLEPDELPISDTGTQYFGTSLSYNNNQGVEAVLSYITVPQSARAYVLPDGETFIREGLQVINPRVRLSSLFGVPGLWAEGEYAYQFSSQQSMAAQAGYLWLGYTADAPWKPSLSYRFAGFSGDDPDTSTYERFDPLQASGLSDWLQGISLGKVYNNSNGFSHRVTLGVQPTNDLSISLDYYYRFADQLNNLGGNPVLSTLESRDLGHEVLLISRYFLSQNFMRQGVGAIAFPGAAIRRAVDDTADPWVTLQLSLFMFF